MNMAPAHDKTRIVITGKGGVGKTTLAALLAHCFARKGKTVLAVDGDPQQNLGVSLGLSPAIAEGIVPLSEEKGYIEEKIGGGPGRGGFMVLNPETADVVDRFGVDAGNGIRLLVMGGVTEAGAGCLCPEYALLGAVFRNAGFLRDDVVILDTPAGLEHFGRAVAQGFSLALIVTDSSYNALSVARSLSRLAHQCGIMKTILVVNRSDRRTDQRKIQETAGKLFSATVFIPSDPCIYRYEPSVEPVVEERCASIEAVEKLVESVIRLLPYPC
jgi:CO dehydrogenase maturation factor